MFIPAPISTLTISPEEVDALLFGASRIETLSVLAYLYLNPCLLCSGLGGFCSVFGGVGCAAFLGCTLAFGLGVIGAGGIRLSLTLCFFIGYFQLY